MIANIGLKQGRVDLSVYSEKWKTLFEDEKALILKKIGYLVSDVQHVGSTSVEGLISKPIIDIVIGVESFDVVEKSAQLLSEIGYEHLGTFGIEGRHFFIKESGNIRTHHLHMVLYRGELWNNHIMFRNWLREHPKDREQYAELKKTLAEKYRENREKYTDEKSEFVRRILKLVENTERSES